MTHGVGSVASFSGGGSSAGGGALFATTPIHGHSRRRRDSNDGNDCCIGLLWLLGMFLGSVLCIRKLPPLGRIAVVWFWLIGVTLTVSLLLVRHFYNPLTFEAAANDMRLLTGKVSTGLCSGLKIESNENFNAYLMSDTPLINAGTKEYHISEHPCISKDRYEYWGYYLLTGSSIKIRTCVTKGSTEFFFIKGQENLNKWKDNDHCSDCYVSHIIIYDNSCYEYEYYVDNPDDFYYLYTNRKTSYKGLVTCSDIKVQLNRTSYNTDSSKEKCLSVKKCDFEFLFNSDEKVVYNCPDTPRDDVHTTSTCRFSVLLMLCFFFVLPICLGIGLSLIVYCFIKHRTANVSRAGSVLNTAPINSSDDNADRVSVSSTSRLLPDLPPATRSPPKYDEVIFGEQPPAYGSLHV